MEMTLTKPIADGVNITITEDVKICGCRLTGVIDNDLNDDERLDLLNKPTSFKAAIVSNSKIPASLLNLMSLVIKYLTKSSFKNSFNLLSTIIIKFSLSHIILFIISSLT